MKINWKLIRCACGDVKINSDFHPNLGEFLSTISDAFRCLWGCSCLTSVYTCHNTSLAPSNGSGGVLGRASYLGIFSCVIELKKTTLRLFTFITRCGRIECTMAITSGCFSHGSRQRRLGALHMVKLLAFLLWKWMTTVSVLLTEPPESGRRIIIYCILLIRIAFCHLSENLPLCCLLYDTVNIYFCFLC